MSHCHPHDKFAVIRNQRSGLVLDASNQHVKVQHFTGFPSQLWKLEQTCDPGKYFIVNKGNGKVLDVEGGAGKGNRLITHGKHGGVNQQWFINSDNTIVCATNDLAVDICSERYEAGNYVIAWPNHGGANQKFVLQYQ